jgi:hypothetical protein
MLNLSDNSHIKEDNKSDNYKKASFNNKQLKNMPIIKHFNKIEILYLNDNDISTLSFCQDLPNLKELYMKNNKITDLKEIDYLSLCKNLHTIYLKGNPIQLNNGQIYMKRIKRAVSLIKNIDGIKIIPNKNLNLYMFLKNSNKNQNIKYFNRDLLSKNLSPKNNIINRDINSIDKKNERINKQKIYKDYKSVDNTDKKNHHIKLKKYNNGKKIWNYVNFNDTINNFNEKTERRRKSDINIIKRMIDKSAENSCVNNLNIVSKEENKSQSEKNNVFNSVLLLINGLNLYQLKQLQNYVNKQLSTKLNIYKE